MRTLLVRNRRGRSPFQRVFFLIPLALACVALSWTAQAGTDDEYRNFNTADGQSALAFIITNSANTGSINTAIGSFALADDTSGSYNTATGGYALYYNSTGSYNTATGANALGANTADSNTATGYRALYSNTTGSQNTATGANALQNNTTGRFNTANGSQALISNTTGNDNTATGLDALWSNNSGFGNTANGLAALFYNTIGGNNTANGLYALNSNTTASYNTADGSNALRNNTSGTSNTGEGYNALASNTIGNNNTSNGVDALEFNTTGNNNSANGAFALNQNTTGSNNTAEGISALNKNTTGANNIALGANAGANLTTGSNNIDIGAPGVASEAGKIRIGKSSTATGTFIAGISGKTVASGVGVIVNSSGQLGTILSSARYKTAIKAMDKASEAILALKPVTFRYKEELDPDGVPQFGLIAEEVEKVNRDLVVRDEDGKVTTVRYEAVNAMLLNEFLKEHRNVAEQQSTIADLKTTVAQQQRQIAAQQATAAQQQKQIEALSGINALYSNTTGSANTGTGVGALRASTGANNTANGFQALVGNTTGKSNIAVGFEAGENLTTGSNNIDIGNVGSAGESNTIRIGTKGTQTNTFIAGIGGVTVAGGVGVIIDTKGHLGTVVSSARFKEAIKPMDKPSEAILALKPVSFRYKHELDPEGIPQFGLVAEQVEKVNPDLVVRDADGKVNTVRYEAVNAMLLNEFLKEHQKVEEQGATIVQMKKQIETLTATMQKVSDRVALSKPAPQLVANP